MKKIYFIVFITASMAILSCKKSSAPSVKELIMSKSWKSTGFTRDGIVKDKWCWLNSIYFYTGSGIFFLESGDNLGACFSSDPIGTIYKLNWKLSSDNKWLITQKNISIPPTESDSFEIVSIDASILKTKRILDKSSPPTQTWEDTFTAQ